MKREEQPMKGAWPDPKKIACRNCFFRDRTQITLGEETIPVGITKDFCAVFTGAEGKPKGVLFQNEPCPFYEEDHV